jgi:hypothetical protein
VRWDSPSPLQRNLGPGSYDWTINGPLQGYINRAVQTLHVNLIDKDEAWKTMDAHQFETELFANSTFCALNTNHLRFDPLLKSFGLEASNATNAAVARMLFEQLFVFQDQEEFAAQRKTFRALKAKHDGIVGVHLRTGGGNGWDDPAWDKPESALTLVEQAGALASKSGYKNPGFYFVSDSSEARALVSGLRRSDWLVEMEQVAHLDRSTSQGVRDNDLAFHEFEMLRSCNTIICGKGGFSQMAAITANIPFCRYT